MNRLIVSQKDTGKRVDVFLVDQTKIFSRASWQKLIKARHVLVNRQLTQPGNLLKNNDEVTYVLPAKPKNNIDLPIIFENDDVIVVDKPASLLTHTKDELNLEQTVASTLADKINDKTVGRPGIVHRLDRGTSGVMVIAKNIKTKQYLQKQFQNRSVRKTYIALVEGKLPNKALVLNWPIERNPKKPSTFKIGSKGKPAVTKLKVLKASKDKSLVELQPQTGRTHQLRVHLKHLGHPILGDRVYGHAKTTPRLMLHAHRLGIAIAHNNWQEFEAPLPQDLKL